MYPIHLPRLIALLTTLAAVNAVPASDGFKFNVRELQRVSVPEAHQAVAVVYERSPLDSMTVWFVCVRHQTAGSLLQQWLGRLEQVAFNAHVDGPIE